MFELQYRNVSVFIAISCTFTSLCFTTYTLFSDLIKTPSFLIFLLSSNPTCIRWFPLFLPLQLDSMYHILVTLFPSTRRTLMFLPTWLKLAVFLTFFFLEHLHKKTCKFFRAFLRGQSFKIPLVCFSTQWCLFPGLGSHPFEIQSSQEIVPLSPRGRRNPNFCQYFALRYQSISCYGNRKNHTFSSSVPS